MMECHSVSTWRARAAAPRGRCAARPSPAALAAAALFLLSCLALPRRAEAHDYWFEPDGAELALFRGHKFSEHQDEPIVPYAPENVRAAFCLRGDGAFAPAPFGKTYPVHFPADCAALIADTDSGYWSQTLTGTVNEPESEVFGVLKSWRALESVKRVTAWHAKLAEPMSQALEVVLPENPFQTRRGGKLRLRVTLGGQPAPGVTVAYDGKARGLTGTNGEVNLRLRHGGEQRISASIELPLHDGRADRIVHSTILFFTLPEEKP
jgi:nickel transport protein